MAARLLVAHRRGWPAKAVVSAASKVVFADVVARALVAINPPALPFMALDGSAVVPPVVEVPIVGGGAR